MFHILATLRHCQLALLLSIAVVSFPLLLEAQTSHKQVRVDRALDRQSLRFTWPALSKGQWLYQLSLSKNGQEVWKKQSPDTLLELGTARELLQSGQWYQLRVTALEVLSGKQEILVEQQAWQAPLQCASVTDLRLQPDGSNALLCSWDKPDAYAYQLRYRVFDALNAAHGPWKLLPETNKGSLRIPDLASASAYQVQVQRNCVWEQSTWADAGVATLQAQSLQGAALADSRCAGEFLPTTDLCAWLNTVELHQVAYDQVKVKWPKAPANWQSNGANLSLALRYRNQGTSTWTELPVPLNALCDGLFSLNNLPLCTNIELEVKATLNASPCAWRSIPGVKTLCKTASDQSGPIWIETPENLTLNCGDPIPNKRPSANDLCTGLSITFKDKELNPGASACARVLERTWIATDDCGKKITYVQTIRFQDKVNPTFTETPKNATLPFGGPLPDENPRATDNCSPNQVSLSLDVQRTQQADQEVVTKTWTATDACGNTNSYVQTIIFKKNQKTPPVKIDYECGKPAALKAAASTLLPSAEIGDVFYIRGFPVRLTEVNGSAGAYTAKGLLSLPFGEKAVFVELPNVTVDKDSWIIAGEARAVASPNFELPRVDPVGGNRAMCIPPPQNPGFDKNGINRATGLPQDKYGFDKNGKYSNDPPYPGYQPGDPYSPDFDPNGFDANGNHAVTKTKYNENGCSREGLDKDGNKCDPESKKPYYWMTNGPQGEPTKAGIALANTYKDVLRGEIDRALRIMDSLNQITINAKTLECNGMRTEMRGLIVQSPIADSAQVFGTESEYLKQGLHKKFGSKPKEMEVTLAGRSQAVTYLENKHVKLYDCDESLQKLLDLTAIIQRLRESAKLDELVIQLLETLRRLPVEETEKIKTPQAFRAWVEAQVKKIVESRQVAPKIGFKARVGSEDPGDAWANAPQTLAPASLMARANFPLEASLVPDFGKAADALKLQQMAFEFQQGLQTIAGLDRAYYLDAIDEARALGGVDQPDEENLLPINIEKELGGLPFKILIDKIVISATGGASADFYAVLPVPGSDSKLAFRALGVSFGPWGASAETKLLLANDLYIPLGNTMRLIISGNDSTFVNFDCSGFAGFNLASSLEVCRSFLVPIDPATRKPLPEPARIKIRINSALKSWEDLFFNVNVPPFAVAGAENYQWTVSNAFLDLSSTKSVPNMIIPANYPNGTIRTLLWQGLYLQQLSLTLPKGLGSDEQATPLNVSANNIIFDDSGLTGSVSVNTPVVSLEQGSLGGWNFSIDKIQINFVANQLAGGAMEGLIHVPLFGNGSTPTPADCFSYVAAISAKNYRFSIKPSTQSMNVNLWKAQVKLLSGSRVDIAYQVDSGFYTIATMNGEVAIGNFSDSEGAELSLPPLSFTGLQLANKAPYFTPGNWKVDQGKLNANLGGFKIAVSEPRMVAGESVEQAALAINVMLGVSEEAKLSANGRIRLIGKLTKSGTRQRWNFEKIQVDALNIDGSFPGVQKIRGSVAFFRNDATFGKGFRGALDVTFSAIPARVEAVAQFGRMSDYEYFMVDAKATFAPAIPLGALRIKALGGGVYFHMSRPDAAPGLGGAADYITTPGASLSGIVYTPSSTIGLGFKATVGVTAPQEKVFNAVATLEVAFNSKEAGGGLASVWFYGTANFMTQPKLDLVPAVEAAKMLQAGTGKPSRPASSAAVTAVLSMQYNFNTTTFHADLEVFVQSPGLVGQGKAELHFAKDNWYIYIGKPSSRIDLQMGVGPLEINTSAYMMAGSVLEPMPDPPATVTNVLGANYKALSTSSRGAGGGFAFGANLNVKTDVDLAIVFLAINADLGFDVMIREYGSSTCAGRSGTVGIDGWYASGQVYAGLSVKGGVKFGRKKFNILDLSVAALLQAQLPNPFYARGNVAGNYRILGGLVKGKFDAKFTLGEQCGFSNDPGGQQALEVIQSMEPGDGSQDVSVAVQPKISFVAPVNATTDFIDENGGKTSIRIDLEQASLLLNGEEIYTVKRFNGDGTELILDAGDMLPAKKTLQLKVKVKVGLSGEAPSTVEKTITFTTGEALQEIPAANIALSYPLVGMKNFHPAEWSRQEGFIQLKTGQPELLFNLPAGKKIELAIMQGSSEVKRVSLTYDPLAKKLSFPLPAESFQGGRNYNLRLLLTGNGAETPIGSLEFRTSIYRRFEDKLKDFANTQRLGVNGLGISICGSPNETFDDQDLGKTGSPALVYHEALLENSSWNSLTLQKLYRDGVLDQNDATPARKALGFPPKNAVNLSSEGCIIYDVFEQVASDIRLAKASNSSASNNSAIDSRGGPYKPDPLGIGNLSEQPPRGSYHIRVEYRLPDGVTTTIGKLSFTW